MKPVGIFRHYPSEGPGYFATYLERRGLPWQLIAIDAGESVPAHPARFSGLAFMGGPMSVNDPLPWIDPVLRLIRQAVAADVPVIGHCLGGQLLARALGGVVTRSPHKEIGWGEVEVVPGHDAEAWLGELECFTGFHWHGETFSIPLEATRLAASRWCPNQAFSRGKHLGMQCHVEMTAQLVDAWCASGSAEIRASPGPGVQSVAAIRRDLDRRLDALHRVADRFYARWVEGLSSSTSERL